MPSLRVQLPLSERRLLLMAGDAVCNLLAVFIALRVWAWVGQIPFASAFLLENLWWFALLQALWILIASANDFYDLRVAADLTQSATRLLQIMLHMVLIYILIFFLSPREALPRLFILYFGLASFVLIVLWRAWRPFLIGWTTYSRRAMIVGTGWAARAMLEVLQQQAQQDYQVVCVLGHPDGQQEVDETITLLQPGQNLADVAANLGVSEIILAYGAQMPGAIFQGVMDAYERGYAITPMPLLYEQITGRVPIEYVGEHNWNIVLPVATSNLFNPYPLLKRIMDVSLALLGSLVFVLLLPGLMLAILIDSPGPIFFRQERVGKGGQPFKILKLRTMIPNAEQVSGPKWAEKNDPRVTRVGRYLRKSRLDELPQLINVLRGEMSLIGPRPERPPFVDSLTQEIPFYRTRHIIRPGLTGWAQVKHGYGNTLEDALIKLQYDLYYIRHQSLVLDAIILLRTIRKVLSLGGM
jgi:exopolysaccharide biosynthesis polyprenyl glycosylphosphotransferase